MNSLWDGQTSLAINFLIVVVIAIICIVLLQAKQIRKQNKRITSLLNGHEGVNLEQALMETNGVYKQLLGEQKQLRSELELLKQKTQAMKANVGVVRYNAFSGQGTDLSFSVSWIDDNQDGVVFSGIHGREETYVYAKPIKQGQSTYPLSPEEKAAIDQALKKSVNG